MAKPADFYVGIVTFFAILVPGAVATAMLQPLLGPAVVGPLVPPPASGAAAWAYFLVTAYFLGHLIFLVGSYIDPFYGFLRERFDPYGNESAFRCATRIRNRLLAASEQKALNTFQWSRALLITQWPEAAADVQGLEADSKFFRSLLVVFLLAAGVFVADGRSLPAILALALVAACFLRYYERRLKSTTQAYLYIVTLYRLCKLGEIRDADGNGDPLALS